MKFKTNAKCGGCVTAIGEKLNTVLKSDEWQIDLDSADKTLTVTGDIAAEKVVALVAEAGFKAQPLP